MARMDEAYIDDNGKRWKSYREYCNSDEPDFDVKCVMLETGRRTPQNDWEREYVRNHREHYQSGDMAIEHPFD